MAPQRESRASYRPRLTGPVLLPAPPGSAFLGLPNWGHLGTCWSSIPGEQPAPCRSEGTRSRDGNGTENASSGTPRAAFPMGRPPRAATLSPKLPPSSQTCHPRPKSATLIPNLTPSALTCHPRLKPASPHQHEASQIVPHACPAFHPPLLAAAWGKGSVLLGAVQPYSTPPAPCPRVAGQLGDAQSPRRGESHPGAGSRGPRAVFLNFKPSARAEQGL